MGGYVKRERRRPFLSKPLGQQTRFFCYPERARTAWATLIHLAPEARKCQAPNVDRFEPCTTMMNRL
jgi:hypothetical protein